VCWDLAQALSDAIVELQGAAGVLAGGGPLAAVVAHLDAALAQLAAMGGAAAGEVQDFVWTGEGTPAGADGSS
jgi:hypothetical protein